MDFAAARKQMVDAQVRVNDVTNRALQAALLTVPRERFCAAERAFAAYAEVQPEIAGGRRLMLPRDVSKLLHALDIQPGERVLALAAPYAAAVAAQLGGVVTAQDDDAAQLRRHRGSIGRGQGQHPLARLDVQRVQQFGDVARQH
ncbi:MAG: hypothetical protein ACK47T_13435, partial [Brevundimonas sp.]